MGTRTDAADFAKRNRGTSDWFRHDGKNVEEQVAPPQRLTSANAKDIASKNSGETEAWYDYNRDAAPEAAAAAAASSSSDSSPTKTPTESKQIEEKIQGKDEKWFKHDDNQDYVSPRTQVENLPDFGPSKSFKVKFTKPDTNDWYKHADGGGNPAAQSPPPKPKKYAVTQKPAPEPPGWFADKTDGSEPAGAGDAQPHSRLTHPDADQYLQRNKGSAGNWFGHDPSATPQPSQSPRTASKEGGDIAKKLGRESENWFDYQANKEYVTPVSEKGSQEARDMLHKSRGQMAGIFSHGASADAADAAPRVKPEARDIAEKNKQGLMDKYLTENKDYMSARPAPRVKPEAAETASKNKGVMDDCMGGYPDPPTDHTGPRVRSEAQSNADRNKGSMGSMIGGGDPPPDRHSQARAVKPEAQRYADRNQGSLGQMYKDMSVSDSQPSGRRGNPARHSASLSGVMGFSG